MEPISISVLVGVFESVNSSDPVLDKLVFVSGLSLNTNTILGEKIKGAESGAIAVVVDRINATTVEIATLTASKFLIGESVTFQESNITTNLQGITKGLFLDVTSNFTLDDPINPFFIILGTKLEVSSD